MRTQGADVMADPKRRLQEQWTSVQAYTLAVVCLVVGLAGGWLGRGSQAAPAGAAGCRVRGAHAPAAVAAAAVTAPDATNNTAQPNPEQMKRTADAQAEPLLVQLKGDPGNPALLAQIGNVYYDAQQFETAIEYYQQALKVKPHDSSVRTDLA